MKESVTYRHLIYLSLKLNLRKHSSVFKGNQDIHALTQKIEQYVANYSFQT